MNPDSMRYVRLAQNLWSYGAFAQDDRQEGITHQAVLELRAANGTLPPADAHGLRPDAFRTPLYPLFIVATGGVSNLRWTLVVQCVLGALMSVFAVWIAEAFGIGVPAAL